MPDQLDLTGRVFGKLVARRRIPGAKGAKARYACDCECGNRCTVRVSHLLAPNGVRGCRVCQSGAPGIHRPYARTNLTGKTIGFLKVLRPAQHLPSPRPLGKTAWLCLCACGRQVVIATANLTRGKKPRKSCGCHWLLPAAEPTTARVVEPLTLAPELPDVLHAGNGNGSNGNGHHDSPAFVDPDPPEHTSSGQEMLNREHDQYSALGKVRRVSWPVTDEDDGVGHCEIDGDPMVMARDDDG